MSLVTFWIAHRAELVAMLGQHVLLVAFATTVAVAVGLPLGILAHQRPRLAAPLVGFANIVQTIPSLAMFGFLIPVPFIGGIGARAALVVLILYGLLPVIRTTAAGLAGIDRAVIDAGIALGMTPRQLLFQVQLPLAAPSVVAGIRVATVVGVGTATIAAAIGAGGLGEYIFRGLSMVDPTVILAGAIPAALLALAADGVLTLAERHVGAAARGAARPRRFVLATLLSVAVVVGAAGAMASATRGAIRVGSKNFTEQLILGELLAQTFERYAGLPVDRRLNLGGTFICDRAVLAGEIDAYVEYTGTALTAIFQRPIGPDAAAVVEQVREEYARTGRTMFAPLGFDNTFAILIRGSDARRLGLQTIEDTARHTPGWRAGFGYEFLEREDGFPGLARAYGLRFAAPPTVMDLALIYRALAEGQVDLIAGDATNGLIAGLDLFMLEDNREYLPPYDAVPVVHAQTLLRHPAIGPALHRIAGRLPASRMQAMNYGVDVERRDIAAVVREFLDGLDDAEAPPAGRGDR